MGRCVFNSFIMYFTMCKNDKQVLSMKFEEKRKKNKNCVISHIVRPEVTPEVYNQKQNTLFRSDVCGA